MTSHGPRSLGFLAVSFALGVAPAAFGAPSPAREALAETGAAHPALEPLDALMRRFLKEHDIPGAALAVAKDGRLVYARGFGMADREREQPVQPDSLFRIASISKPITAVAVLRQVERGKIALDQPVFAARPNGFQLPLGQPADPRLANITVRHLLQHRGGWDRDVSIDPMFHSTAIAAALGTKPPAGASDVIRFMMGWRLDFDPGARYAYSNFGYNLLGRVIERATGRNYEQHVREEVLRPLGITGAVIGKTAAAGRAAGEVCYYTPGNQTGLSVMGAAIGAQVPQPYGAWHLEAMDSHGGWIASARDLVRFGSAVAAPERHKLLTAETTSAMFARPEGPAGRDAAGKPKDVYYGMGWQVRPVGTEGCANHWHNGLLAGTSTLLVLRHDGLCWAALFNTQRTPAGAPPASVIDPLIHQAADAVKAWPSHDLWGAAPPR